MDKEKLLIDIHSNQAKMMEQIDNIEEDISEIKVDVKRNTEDISDHIKRTNLLEEQIKNRPCKQNFDAYMNSRFNQRLKWVAWIVGILVGIGTLVTLYINLI